MTVFTEVRCNQCDIFGDAKYASRDALRIIRENLSKAGWTCRRGIDLCPTCRSSPPKDTP